MANIITKPVELGFSEFVSKLISDTFEAVIATSISQEEDWSQLDELLAQDIDTFTSLVVDGVMIENELMRLFPDEEGGTAIVKDAKYTKANQEKQITESPPIETLTGHKPTGNKLTENDVLQIKLSLKKQLGEKQYEVLSKVFSKGATKVIVDAGKINAKLNFSILQESETEEAEDNGGDPLPDINKRIFVKRGIGRFGGLSRPIEMKGVHFFVKPPSDGDPQTHNVKANIYGEVEIQFKTIR